jgi:hypothetical protein
LILFRKGVPPAAGSPFFGRTGVSLTLFPLLYAHYIAVLSAVKASLYFRFYLTVNN